MWFIYSLLCAISLSVSDLLSKIALREADIYIVSWVKVAFAFVFLLFWLAFIKIPTLNLRFFIICLILFPLEVLAIFLYIKAIHVSPLSLTVPYLSFTPLFLIVTSYLMLGEQLDISGFLGVVLIVAGSYLLNYKYIFSGFLDPLKAVFYEKGSFLMIVVAAVYSITSNLGKLAIEETSPVFFAIIYSGITSLLIFPFLLFFSRKPLKQIKDNFRLFIGIGGSSALMTIFHMLAIIRIEVTYMISIKRTSPIFSVILGYVFLREEDFMSRLTGTMVMFVGVLFILF